MDVTDLQDEAVPLLIANKYGKINGVFRGAGDQSSTGFFKSIRLRMGDATITEPYKQHVWTYACVTALSEVVSSVPFVIVREAPSSDREKKFKIRRELMRLRSMKSKDRVKFDLDLLEERGFEVIEDGPVYNTFTSVNPLMTAQQLWAATTIYYALDGDVFWVLENGNNQPIQNPTEWPKEIYPVGADSFKPLKDGNDMQIGWHRKQGKIDIKYELWQVIHFYKFNPYNPIDGLSPFEVIRSAAVQDAQASAYNEAFFANGAEPGGILEVPGNPQKEQRTAIINAWNDQHKGPGKSNKTALLTAGAKYNRNPRTHSDMQYLEGRKWNRDETFAGFRTPKQLASIYEDLNYATAGTQLKQYWENVVIPVLNYFEDMVNGKMMSRAREGSGLYVMFDLSKVEALREDMSSKSETATRLSQIGIPTSDIIDLLEINVEKKGWQDKWWAPMNLVPITGAGFSPDPEEPDEPEEPKEGKIISDINKVCTKLQRAIDKEKFWNLYVAKVLNPYEENYRKKIKAFWFDLRKHQLKLWDEATKMVRATPSQGELSDILFNDVEWGEKLINVSKPYISGSMSLSIDEVSDELGGSPMSMEDPRVIAALNTKLNKIKGITNRFWNGLQSYISEGLEAGETVNEIQSRIKDAFNQAASYSRTLTIARTEISQSTSAVRHEAFKVAGVEKHEWGTAGDENVRDDHVTFGAQEAKGLNYNYMRAVGKSGTLLYPNDMQGPADQVINCRCVELFVK